MNFEQRRNRIMAQAEARLAVYGQRVLDAMETEQVASWVHDRKRAAARLTALLAVRHRYGSLRGQPGNPDAIERIGSDRPLMDGFMPLREEQAWRTA